MRIHNAQIRVLNGGQPVFETHVDLDPAERTRRLWKIPSCSPYTIQLRDSGGAILLEHVEGKYDADGPDKVKLGTVPEPIRKAKPPQPCWRARTSKSCTSNGVSPGRTIPRVFKKFPSDMAWVARREISR